MSENQIRTQIKLIAKTDVGKVRDHNEDNYVVCPDVNTSEWYFSDKIIEPIEGTLLVIADGMGGMNAGELASAITIDTIQKYFNSPERIKITTQQQVNDILVQCINDAQTNILAQAKENSETSGMGTTIVIAFIKDNILHTAWVGDSRCYVFRNNKELYFASKDHSYVQELVDSGQLNMDQAFYHPDNNIITRSLGDNSNKIPKPDFCSFPLEMGDKVLLCSDGLNGMLKDDAIAKILHNNENISNAGNELIDNANEAGGHDNITIILAEVIKISNIEYPKDLKLRKLELACSYSLISDSENPFKTLSPTGSTEISDKPIAEIIVSKKKNKKLYLIIALLLPIIILSVMFFIWQKTNLINANNKSLNDTLKVVNVKESRLKDSVDKLKPGHKYLNPPIKTSDKVDNSYDSPKILIDPKPNKKIPKLTPIVEEEIVQKKDTKSTISSLKLTPIVEVENLQKKDTVSSKNKTPITNAKNINKVATDTTKIKTKPINR